MTNSLPEYDACIGLEVEGMLNLVITYRKCDNFPGTSLISHNVPYWPVLKRTGTTNLALAHIHILYDSTPPTTPNTTSPQHHLLPPSPPKKVMK